MNSSIFSHVCLSIYLSLLSPSSSSSVYVYMAPFLHQPRRRGAEVKRCFVWSSLLQLLSRRRLNLSLYNMRPRLCLGPLGPHETHQQSTTTLHSRWQAVNHLSRPHLLPRDVILLGRLSIYLYLSASLSACMCVPVSIWWLVVLRPQQIVSCRIQRARRICLCWSCSCTSVWVCVCLCESMWICLYVCLAVRTCLFWEVTISSIRSSCLRLSLPFCLSVFLSLILCLSVSLSPFLCLSVSHPAPKIEQDISLVFAS